MTKAKKEIMERLGKLKRELNDLEALIKNAELLPEKAERDFRKSFGSWKDERNAEGIIDEIKKSRKSTDRTPKL